MGGASIGTTEPLGGSQAWRITTWVRLGQSEIGNPLFIQPQVPPDCYIVLSLQDEEQKHTNISNQRSRQVLLHI